MSDSHVGGGPPQPATGPGASQVPRPGDPGAVGPSEYRIIAEPSGEPTFIEVHEFTEAHEFVDMPRVPEDRPTQRSDAQPVPVDLPAAPSSTPSDHSIRVDPPTAFDRVPEPASSPDDSLYDRLEATLSAASAPVDEEMWSWAHTAEPESDPRLSNRQVALIVVAHNGADWLPQTLKAISRLEHPPGAVVAVDAASSDESRALLSQAKTEGTVHLVLDAPADQGFGAAVALAEEQIPPGFSWLWLLHDDAQVRPDTLSELRTALDHQPRPDLVYPKLLFPKLRHHSDRISEIGESLTSTGDRYLSIEPGDLDQRQTEAAPVLGGSTCGLFIRRQAWRDLGGTDPGLPLFRDGLDLGWRANDVGLRVMTWPNAAIYHVQAGRGGLRDTALTRDPERLDLVLGMRLAVARSRHPARTRLAAVLHSAVRSFWLLLGRSPGDARRSLSAARVLLSHPRATRRLRERHPHATEQGALRPTAWHSVRLFADRLAGRVGDAVRDLRDEPETGLDDLIGDDFSGSRHGPRWARPGPLVGVAMVVLVLVAARQAWGTGHLVSSQLLPAPDTLTEAWRAALRPLAGQPGSNAPWLLWTAIGSTITLGRPEFLARGLILLAPLWSYLSAARAAARNLGPGWRPNVIGFAWAALVVSSGVVGRGSIAAAAAAILIPWIISLCYRWWDQDDAGSVAEAWRVPALIAVLIAVLASAYPLVLPAGLGLSVVMAVVLARERGLRSLVGLSMWPGFLLLVVGPGLVVLPWATRLLSQPGRLLTGPDPLAWPAGPAPAWWQVLLGRSVAGAGAALPPWWVSLIVVGGLWVAVGYLIVRRAMGAGPRHGTRLVSWSPVGWSIAFVGFTVSAVLARLSVTVDGVAVRGGTDPWILLGLAGLMVVAMSRFTPRREGEQEPLRELAGPAALMLVALGLVGMLWWVVGAPATPLRTTDSALPAYVRDAQEAPRAARTLMVSVGGGTATWSVVSERRPQWGSGEGQEGLSPLVATLVGQIASGAPPEDLAGQLTSLGIAHVWMRGGSSDQVLGVSNAPGLTALRADENTVVWTVAGRVGQVRIQEGSDESNLSTGVVESGSADRILVLAVTPDPRWEVTVGGQRLQPSDTPADGSWGASFKVGAASGPVTYRIALATGAGWLTGLSLLGLLIFAAPSASRDLGTGAPKRARRSG